MAFAGRSRWGSYVLAAALGLLVGWFDASTSNDDGAKITIAMLLASSFFVGCWQPRAPWRRALVVALCVPLFHLGTRLAGRVPNVHPDSVTTLLILVPLLTFICLVGSYLGAAVRSNLAR